jgi:arsenical pump membrane protein
MPAPTSAHLAVWTLVALVAPGVILRPWGLPEAIWSVAGALLLLGRWVTLAQAGSAIA